ncbi:hypothetical protein E4T56_gene4309 [Termitomyces sp. T112]|nr:hypothetical protein E4T56_gene4309 [Termitomyces sp. T112]
MISHQTPAPSPLITQPPTPLLPQISHMAFCLNPTKTVSFPHNPTSPDLPRPVWITSPQLPAWPTRTRNVFECSVTNAGESHPPSKDSPSAAEPPGSAEPDRDRLGRINLEEGTSPPFGKIYNMSEIELQALKEYLNDMLSKGFICPSISATGTPVLFTKKKDGSLQLCVDYWGPNKVTKKNQYPLPLIGDLVNHLCSAKIYTKIDLCSGFINNYSRITKPLNQLMQKDTPWDWDSKCQSIFLLLKKAFTSAPVLHHFDPSLPVVLECDASDYAIARILSQSDSGGKDLHSVIFYTCSMIPTELNYNIYDKELLTIVEAFHQWQAYLEESPHCIQVYSNHNNLQYFMTTKQLSHCQAQWSEALLEVSPFYANKGFNPNSPYPSRTSPPTLPMKLPKTSNPFTSSSTIRQTLPIEPTPNMLMPDATLPPVTTHPPKPHTSSINPPNPQKTPNAPPNFCPCPAPILANSDASPANSDGPLANFGAFPAATDTYPGPPEPREPSPLFPIFATHHQLNTLVPPTYSGVSRQPQDNPHSPMIPSMYQHGPILDHN